MYNHNQQQNKEGNKMINKNDMFDRKKIFTRYAIQTRYHAGTDTQESRMSASYDKHRVYIPVTLGENEEQNHARAAQALLDKHFKIDDSQYPNARYLVNLHSGLTFDDDFYWTFDVVV